MSVGKIFDLFIILENIQILSNGWWQIFTATAVNVVKNQYYRGYVTFIEYGGSAYVQLYWSYTGVSQIIVPSTSLYYPTYITSAPIQVTVTCPSGYSTSTSAGYPQCVTTCGDGYRVGSEAWDDSNTTPNDGCSATCTVESGYTCTGGSGTSKDTCSKPVYTCPSGYTWTIGSCTSISDCTNLSYSCPSGYTWTSRTCTSISDCSQTVTSICSSDYNLSSFNRWMALVMWSTIIICFIINLIIGCLTDKYPSGLYTWLEHIQLFTILPLAGSCFSSKVNGFFRLASYSLLGFDFIDIKQVFYINLDYTQDNKVLSFIGFSSSSTIINICLTITQLNMKYKKLRTMKSDCSWQLS